MTPGGPNEAQVPPRAAQEDRPWSAEDRMVQERPRRGPGHRGKDKRTQEETGQEQTRLAPGRDNILTKGLPGPLDPEHLN